MSLPIISAQQRMAERKGVKLLMLGKSGIGKTTRLKDLDPATTLFLDIEAGDLAVADWPGDTIRPASWPESRDVFVFLAGPDRSLTLRCPVPAALRRCEHPPAPVRHIRASQPGSPLHRSDPEQMPEQREPRQVQRQA